MVKVFGSDSSDSTIRFRNLSILRLPEASLKGKIWENVTKLDKNVSNYQEYRHECQGFMIVPNQYDLVKHYFDNYYHNVRDMMASKSISQAKAHIFMNIMCPLLIRKDGGTNDLQKVMDLL